MNRLMRYEPSSIEPVFDLLHKLFHSSRGLAVDEEESVCGDTNRNADLFPSVTDGSP